MTQTIDEVLSVDKIEAIIAILATKPARTPIKDPSRQLAKASRELPDSPIKRALKIHPAYQYSATLTREQGMLMVGGIIMYGSDDKYRLSEQGHIQGTLIMRRMTPKQIEDCNYIGERLQWG